MLPVLVAQGDAHDHVFDLGIGVGPVVLHVALLAVVPVVAGFALLRAFLPAPSRIAAAWVIATAGGVVVLELLLAGGLSLPVQVVPPLFGALAGALYAIRSTDPRFARLRRVLRAVAPGVVGLSTMLALVEFGRGWLTGGAIALHTGVMLAMVGLAWFVVCAPRTTSGRVVVDGTAAVLAIALVGGVAQAIVLRPTAPVPGIATAGEAAGVAVTIVPNLPGWNLVHVPAGASTVGTAVGPAQERLVPALSRPGATGAWAAVRLPAGRGELWVHHQGVLDSLRTDTGGTGTAPAELLGPDGPECASAMLGAMLAAGAATLPACPSGALDPADAAALEKTVGFLAGRGHRTLTVVTDETQRGRAATGTVAAAAAAVGIDITHEGGPALVVAGWSVADRDLRTGTGPVYLAPWLLTPGLLAGGGAPHVVQRFDQDDPLPRRYLLALDRGYPGEQPSATGYRTWLAGQRELETGEVRIHQVTASHTYGPANGTHWPASRAVSP